MLSPNLLVGHGVDPETAFRHEWQVQIKLCRTQKTTQILHFAQGMQLHAAHGADQNTGMHGATHLLGCHCRPSRGIDITNDDGGMPLHHSTRRNVVRDDGPGLDTRTGPDADAR